MVNVELSGEAGRGEAVFNAQFAARAVAIGVDRGLRHPQFACDLLGRKVLVDKAQAIALTLGKQAHRICDNFDARAHGAQLTSTLRIRLL